MRLGDLTGKEIINIYDGARLGAVETTDITIDLKTGLIQSIVLPQRNNLMNFWSGKQELTIPWKAVKKIGAEVIIVEIKQAAPMYAENF